MNDYETRRSGTFGRVQTFNTDNTADFAAGGDGKKRFTQLCQFLKDLDAIVRHKYASQPVKLHAWLTASRVHRSPHRMKPPESGTDGVTPTPKPSGA